MKLLIPLSIVLTLLLSACGSYTDDKSPAETTAVTAEQRYACESGEAIVANYTSTESATVNYKGSDYEMKIAVSGSGSRYVGSEIEWWTKGSGAGSEGTLFGHNADGSTGDVMENCKAS